MVATTDPEKRDTDAKQNENATILADGAAETVAETLQVDGWGYDIVKALVSAGEDPAGPVSVHVEATGEEQVKLHLSGGFERGFVCNRGNLLTHQPEYKGELLRKMPHSHKLRVPRRRKNAITSRRTQVASWKRFMLQQDDSKAGDRNQILVMNESEVAQ
ncbi:hypothetical protein BC830DRAFT_1086145 [Chytriomyces sp. MP71]|nr:hypothetical protein BC830DRAFT_1086145 [Chytriomyces sp. MP71]